MLPIVLALLAVVAPPVGEYTARSRLCAHDPGLKALTGVDTYYSLDTDRVWAIGKDRLFLVDRSRLMSARHKPFFVRKEPVTLKGATYVMYGLPRTLSVSDLEPKAYAFKDRAPFYVASGDTTAEVVYLLTRPVGCEFQAYQRMR